MLRVNYMSLRVVIVVFQSIYNKKGELNLFLIENDVDTHTFFISNAFFFNSASVLYNQRWI